MSISTAKGLNISMSTLPLYPYLISHISVDFIKGYVKSTTNLLTALSLDRVERKPNFVITTQHIF